MNNFLRKYKSFKINEFLKGKFKLATRTKTTGEIEKENCRSARLEGFADEVFKEQIPSMLFKDSGAQRVGNTSAPPSPQLQQHRDAKAGHSRGRTHSPVHTHAHDTL